jgi:phosphoribosyl 1,2-cyclic phosphodiesterase
MHSSLMLTNRGHRVMIDCGLDWIDAVWLLKPRPQAIVLTHAHPDHAWGLKNGAPCPVYATHETWDALGSYAIPQRHVVRERRPLVIGGIAFEAFAVEHSIRAPAVGYRIATGQRSVLLYVPDVVWIHQAKAALSGVNLYIGDGASITRPLIRRRGRRLFGHASVSTQLMWCQKAGIERAIITHCGRGIVSAHGSASAVVRAIGEQRGVDAQIACDGLIVHV